MKQADYQRDLLFSLYPQRAIKGRMVTVTDYPACGCGEGRGCLVQVSLEGRADDGVLGGGLVGDGVLLRTESKFDEEGFQSDTIAIREVGRRECSIRNGIVHVYYHWEWKE